MIIGSIKLSLVNHTWDDAFNMASELAKKYDCAVYFYYSRFTIFVTKDDTSEGLYNKWFKA
jgi:hypothetical protein